MVEKLMAWYELFYDEHNDKNNDNVKKCSFGLVQRRKVCWKCFEQQLFENMQSFHSMGCEHEWILLMPEINTKIRNISKNEIPRHVVLWQIFQQIFAPLKSIALCWLDIGILMKYSFGSFWGKYVLCRQFLEIVTSFGFKVAALSETVTGSNTLADQGGWLWPKVKI